MSFTIKVKEELLTLHRFEKSELSALIKMSGSLGLSMGGLSLSLTTENAKIARHIYELIVEFYQVKSDIRHHQKTNLKKNRVYTVSIDEKVEEILADLHLADSFFGIETGIDPRILEEDEASRAYLRGAFLASGTIKDPESGHFLLDAKTIERKKGVVTYLQRAEDIIDFLILVEAKQALEEFESVKVMREARNDLNRANNAEMANIARTVTASMKTINNIVKIMDTIGLGGLPVELQEVAYVRIQNPDYSIQQIADALKTPLTKSGVNHRLRKINKIADELDEL